MTRLAILNTLFIVLIIFGFVNGQAEGEVAATTAGNTNSFDDIDWSTFDFGSFNFSDLEVPSTDSTATTTDFTVAPTQTFGTDALTNGNYSYTETTTTYNNNGGSNGNNQFNTTSFTNFNGFNDLTAPNVLQTTTPTNGLNGGLNNGFNYTYTTTTTT